MLGAAGAAARPSLWSASGAGRVFALVLCLAGAVNKRDAGEALSRPPHLHLTQGRASGQVLRAVWPSRGGRSDGKASLKGRKRKRERRGGVRLCQTGT